MAKRPIFLPKLHGEIGVTIEMVSFTWHAGFAKSQKQKSINELHQSASAIGVSPILEISSKSEVELGVALSAFNLLITTKKYKSSFSVESAFQGSKVFENGGPFKDLFSKSPREAKKDDRIKSSGNILNFEFFGQVFPKEPKTAFYDWLYINALAQNTELANELHSYQAFSDIEFNPDKSINCQAHSAALYVSLINSNIDMADITSPEDYLALLEINNFESGEKSFNYSLM